MLTAYYSVQAKHKYQKKATKLTKKKKIKKRRRENKYENFENIFIIYNLIKSQHYEKPTNVFQNHLDSILHRNEKIYEEKTKIILQKHRQNM